MSLASRKAPRAAGGGTAAWLWAMRLTLVLAAGFMLFHTVGPRPNLLAWDKAEHFCGALGLLLLLAGSFPRAPLWRVAVFLAAAIFLAELVQLGLPDRSADLEDLASGLLGLGAGLCAFAVVALRKAAAGS